MARLIARSWTALDTEPAIVDPHIDPEACCISEKVSAPEVSVLTAQMARGDEAAFRTFSTLYFNRLLGYLLVVARGNEEVAREALQLTFIRIARHVRRFESETVFWNWLTVLARSSVRDEFRKENRYRALLRRFLGEEPASSDGDVSDAAEEFAGLVARELEEMPAEERSLLERKYFDGETVKQLAEELNLTEKALDSRLLRIRRKLKTAVLEKLSRNNAVKNHG